jgi:uncharacterized protein (DUF362 family)
MTGFSRPIDRRDFLRATAAGLALLPMVGPDGLRIRRVPRTSRVALVRTADRKRGVAEVLKLFNPAGMAGKRAVVKPNFNTADDAPGSTHSDTLSQLVTELKERDVRSVTLGESSGPPQTRGVMERKGVFDLAQQLGFDVVNFDEIPESDWVPFGAEGTHWPEGFHLPRLVVDSEYLGLTPKPIRRTMHRSPDMRRMIAELNTGYRPQLIVLDGVSAFTDGGPSSGEVKQGNVVLAGDDRVAVDAVGLAVLKELGANAAIMGRRIFEQEQIARAVELGLGVSGPGEIELVTSDAESQAYASRLERILADG